VEGEIVRDLTLCGERAAGVEGRRSERLPADAGRDRGAHYANTFKWKTSDGEDRYRRGMYTYFKRTAPYPGLLELRLPRLEHDLRAAPDLEHAAAGPHGAEQRGVPEAARVFAARLLGRENVSDRELVALAFRKCVARAPTAEEVERLLKLLNASVDWYNAHPDEARRRARRPRKRPGRSVTRILLNLDEFLTRE
jgi:hypothetical protein